MGDNVGEVLVLVVLESTGNDSLVVLVVVVVVVVVGVADTHRLITAEKERLSAIRRQTRGVIIVNG